MFFVGKPKVLAKRLSDVSYNAMWLGIKEIKPGAQIGNIGYVIQQYVQENRFSVVREYCGHGIGKAFHEDPQILHYGNLGEGITLQEGMTITVEPMINSGKSDVKLLNDGWTVVTLSLIHI